jgi:uncharacterized protein YegJ (DUF2314 family)
VIAARSPAGQRAGSALACAVALYVLVSSAPALAIDPNPVPNVPKGDPAMAAAFTRAAASLDRFLAVWRNPPPGAEGFSVKIGLKDTSNAPGYAIVRPGEPTAGMVEWFWMHDLRAVGAGFAAEIDNDAGSLHHVTKGWTIRFTRRDIGDWMYFQNGKIIGNATACPALARASAEERKQIKERYGIDCEGGAL